MDAKKNKYQIKEIHNIFQPMCLTEEQRDIVGTMGKPLLVLAGPGTGKTKVLSHRILHLLRNNLARKEQIIGITFTTKAAEQMKERLEDLGLANEDQPLICTLHSLCMRMLRDNGVEIDIPENFMVADEYESSLILNDAIYDIDANLVKRTKKFSRKILLSKAQRRQPDDVSSGLFKKIYARYQELLRIHFALDFKDLIVQAHELFQVSEETRNTYQAKTQHLLVDEFQDINDAEYSLIKYLAGTAKGLFVVGDDKQSIYGWRGGNPQIILGFTKDIPQAIQKPMTICFRCPEKIIRGADEFIKRDPQLIPQQTNPEPIWVLNRKSDVQEAKYVSEWIKNAIRNGKYSPKDIAVLCRGGDIADKIVRRLTDEGIPMIRPSPEETIHVHEFVACLRLIVDRRDSLALRVCLASKLAKGIGRKGIKELRDYAEDTDCSFWGALIVAKSNSSFARWHKPLREFH